MQLNNPVIPPNVRIKTEPRKGRPFPKKFERKRWSENEIVTIMIKNLKEDGRLRKVIKEVI